MRNILFLMVSFFCIVTVSSGLLAQTASRREELVLTTYYPVPYGDYKELRSQQMAIGPNYSKSSDYCWGGGSCTNPIADSTDLIVEGNVGIGTEKPANAKLAVMGGDVGIGTISPHTPAPNGQSGNLDVNDVYVRGFPDGGKWLSQMKPRFGTREFLSMYTTYEAPSDGLVMAFGTSACFFVNVDSVGSVGYMEGDTWGANGAAATVPIKKGERWSVTNCWSAHRSPTVMWIPFDSF